MILSGDNRRCQSSVCADAELFGVGDIGVEQWSWQHLSGFWNVMDSCAWDLNLDF